MRNLNLTTNVPNKKSFELIGFSGKTVNSKKSNKDHRFWTYELVREEENEEESIK